MIVVDASVWVSFLIKQDVNHEVSRNWLTDVLLNRVPIVDPVLLLPEVSGAIARRFTDADMGDKARREVMAIPTLNLIDIDHSLSVQASQIAAQYGLRGADALYVAVAAQYNLPLISWDKEHLSRVSDLVVSYAPIQKNSF